METEKHLIRLRNIIYKQIKLLSAESHSTIDMDVVIRLSSSMIELTDAYLKVDAKISANDNKTTSSSPQACLPAGASPPIFHGYYSKGV